MTEYAVVIKKEQWTTRFKARLYTSEELEEIARAAAWAAGNASAMKAGRAKWVGEDFAASADTYDRIWDAALFPEERYGQAPDES